MPEIVQTAVLEPDIVRCQNQAFSDQKTVRAGVVVTLPTQG